MKSLSTKIFIVVSIIIMGYMIGNFISIKGVYDEACQEAGFEEFGYWDNKMICKNNNKIYFVDMDCKNMFLWFLSPECEAIPIKVGEVGEKLI